MKFSVIYLSCELVKSIEWLEAAVRRYFVKLVFLKISQYSLESNCTGDFLNKVEGFQFAIFLKKRLRHRCFSVNFSKLLRTFFNTKFDFLQRILQKLIYRPKDFVLIYSCCFLSKTPDCISFCRNTNYFEMYDLIIPAVCCESIRCE